MRVFTYSMAACSFLDRDASRNGMFSTWENFWQRTTSHSKWGCQSESHSSSKSRIL